MYTLNTYDKIADAEREIYDEYLKLESIHPVDIINNRAEVMHEAVLSRIQINKAIDKIIEAIQASLKKFKDISRELNKRNVEWMESAEKFDFNKADFSNFKYEIFPYWEAIPREFNLIKIPKFDINESELYTDQNQFMGKYFKNITDDDGNINKNVLRGLNQNLKEKIPVDYGKAKTIYRYVLPTIKSITELRDKVARDMSKIASTLKSVKNMEAPMNESVVLNSSIFKDEYFDIILEAALTPEKINKEKEKNDNSSDDKDVNIKPNDNQKATDLDKMYKAVTSWSKLCSAVTTAEMDILDEAYNECAKFIDKAMKCK